MGADGYRVKCDFRGRQYRFSHGHYDGKHLGRLQLDVCLTCYEGSEDGWAPIHEKRLLVHLDKLGIEPPKRLGNGLLARG